MTETLAELDDGLVLRRGRRDDVGPVTEFSREVFRDGDGGEDAGVVAWARDLFERPPPGFGPECFSIVADGRGEIVSMLCLIPQTWTYSGMPFGVGRIELVGTRAEYRRRGLVRCQMEVVHRWSVESGHLAQGITGIPWFYRRFGYDMAIDLGGGRSGSLADLPARPSEDPWTVRPARRDDLPFIAGHYDAAMERYLVACRRSDELWRYELTERSPEAVYRRDIAVLERDGEPVGFLVSSGPERGAMFLTLCEVDPEAGRRQGYLAALHHLHRVAGDRAIRVRFSAAAHPSFDALPDVYTTTHRPYAWYVRVPDLPGFLRRIAPVLEFNLAQSPFAGHSGTLRINEYVGGVWLRLEEGRLAGVGDLAPADPEDGDAAFPDHTLLQLVFGRRSAAQLRESRADCWIDDDVVGALLDALFPTAPSLIYPVG